MILPGFVRISLIKLVLSHFAAPSGDVIRRKPQTAEGSRIVSIRPQIYWPQYLPDRSKRPSRLAGFCMVEPTVERSKAESGHIRATSPVGNPIGACAVTRQLESFRTVVVFRVSLGSLRLAKSQCLGATPKLWIQIKTIKIHHLVPDLDKVIDKFHLRIVTGVNFRDGSQL